ncbi:PREDICTED: uncharacterized protein LOC109155197 [Ipomoea nil]|uniref:uncharacterized protein LOC109155197 n=1 Tax=Ipomoea nil TaxID=35883 RepID=UPI000900E7B2|nr:PREDICTED: uncharacterized protein LOC109155197 [Ipomoea nil]
MSKAYGVLISCPPKLGFSRHITNLIRELVFTVEFRILLDGREVGYVVPERSLKQCDPISPYLFIMVLEAFHCMFHKRSVERGIHGVPTQSESGVLENTIDCFAEASGPFINHSKSTVSFSRNVLGADREMVHEVLGIREGNLSGNYLGLPSLIGRNKKAIPTYAMSVFLLPMVLGREIERILNGFWWGCFGERSKGIRWKRWDELCVPNNWGGMRSKRIRDFNIALLENQAWRMIQNPNSLMTKVSKARYFPRDNFFEAKIG